MKTYKRNVIELDNAGENLEIRSGDHAVQISTHPDFNGFIFNLDAGQMLANLNVDCEPTAFTDQQSGDIYHEVDGPLTFITFAK